MYSRYISAHLFVSMDRLTQAMLLRDRRYNARREALDEMFPYKREILKSSPYHQHVIWIIRQIGLPISPNPDPVRLLTLVRTAYETYMSLLPSCSFTGSLTSILIHFPLKSTLCCLSVSCSPLSLYCRSFSVSSSWAAVPEVEATGDPGDMVSNPSPSSDPDISVRIGREFVRGGASSHAIEWKPSSSSG